LILCKSLYDLARTTQDLTAPPKDARSFDKWFYSQTRKQQDKMRDAGVLPYREMRKSPDYVFEVKPDHKDWATTDNQQRTELEAFISREHVGQMLKAFFDALAMTNSLRFRRHVELIRWALSMPGCLSSRQIAEMHGLSHEMIRLKAKTLRSVIAIDALGGFPHANARRRPHTPPRKESLLPPP